MKRQYYYENVFNRIHGYVMLESIPESGRLPDDMKIVSLSLICSSSYSDKKGVGSCLMNFTIDLCKTKFSDIVLEVANEFADVSDISDDESDEDSDEEEYDDTNDEIVERLTSEFVRKSLRLRKSDGFVTPYFNVGEEYIENILYSYMNDEHDVYDYVNDFNTFDIENPGEYDYGGIHYQKGKTSQKVLFQFYEKFGFVERPVVNSTENVELKEKVNVNNDVQREVQIYNVTLKNVLKGLERFKTDDILVDRPTDYYAEMLKDDTKMARIRSNLVQ